MNQLVQISKLFEPVYGINLELLNMEITSKNDPNSIGFVSRKEFDNGLVAYVKRIPSIEPNPAHTISVAVSGSVLASFYQPNEYYSGRDIYYLIPKSKMSVEEMLFYAFCLQANKYRYNYGRGANRTLKDILVPSRMPVDFRKVTTTQINVPKPDPILPTALELNTDRWGKFIIGDLFEIKKGKRLTKEDMEDGNTPFIGAIDSNNGWREFIGQQPIHEGNTITVNYNGNGVADAFYQPKPFWASDDVNVLYPKFDMNIYIALFIASVIRREKYRFSYGRKWHKERMENSLIKLPAKNDKPDFAYMENYIKSMPFSTSLTTENAPLKPRTGKTKRKGLSDDELIEKYESGNAPMKKFMKSMLTAPTPPED